MEEAKTREILVGDLDGLAEGLNRIGGLNIVNHKLNSAIAHNIVKAGRELKILRKTVNALKREYAKKNEKGEFITKPGQDKNGRPATLFVYDKEEELSAKVDEVDAQVVDSRFYRIKQSTLENEKIPGLTPSLMALLDPIIIHDTEIPEDV